MNIKILFACVGFLMFVALMKIPMNQMGEDYVDKDTTQTIANSEPTEKIMYLTFDDGPSKNTEDVLEILKRQGVQATFFVTYENPEYVTLIKRASDEGHAIGIHTYSHKYEEIYSGIDAYLEDFRKMSDIISEQTNKSVLFYRFPGGSSNTVSKRYQNGIVSDIAHKLGDAGYSYFDWNAHNGDGNPSLSASSLVNQALKETKDKNVVMMLMHDGSGNKNTVVGLEDLIKEWKKQGYKFKIINNETDLVFHHKIAN